jgi:hypothetical protein
MQTCVSSVAADGPAPEHESPRVQPQLRKLARPGQLPASNGGLRPDASIVLLLRATPAYLAGRSETFQTPTAERRRRGRDSEEEFPVGCGRGRAHGMHILSFSFSSVYAAGRRRRHPIPAAPDSAACAQVDAPLESGRGRDQRAAALLFRYRDLAYPAAAASCLPGLVCAPARFLGRGLTSWLLVLLQWLVC